PCRLAITPPTFHRNDQVPEIGNTGLWRPMPASRSADFGTFCNQLVNRKAWSALAVESCTWISACSLGSGDRADCLRIRRLVTLGCRRGPHPIWHNPHVNRELVAVRRIHTHGKPHRRPVLIKSRPARLDHRDTSIVRKLEELGLDSIRSAHCDHVAPADLLDSQLF